MILKDSLRKYFCWLLGLGLTILGFVFIEGWLILSAKMLGALKATIFVSVVTVFLSWIVIYLSASSNKSRALREWLSKKEASLSKRAQIAVKGGKALVLLNTAVFLGPIFASILMLMLGFKAKKVYFYAIFFAVLCAGIWCSFYSGVFWGFEKIFQRRNF